MVLAFAFLTCLTITSIIYAKFGKYPVLESFEMLLYLYPFFFTLNLLLQYCHYINLLRSRYKILNEQLKAIANEKVPAAGKYALNVLFVFYM